MSSAAASSRAQHKTAENTTLLNNNGYENTVDDSDSVNNSTTDAEEDAAQQKPVWQMYSRGTAGLYVQYFILGLVYGFFSGMVFSVFVNAIGLTGPRAKSASSIINLPWSLKVFLANFSDSKPIFGYNRKYYCLLGWGFSAVLMVLTALIVGQPNQDTDPVIFVVLLSLCTLSYVLGDVAVDGAVIALAQKHETVETRGNLQATIYFVRYCAMILSGLVISFGFNGPSYGGSFDFELQVPTYLYILASLVGLSMYFFYTMDDEPDQKSTPYWTNLYAMYERLQITVIARVLMFSFLVHVFAYVSNTAVLDIQRQFCDVTPLLDGLFNQVGSYIIMSLAIFMTKKYLLNVSWHKVLTSCIIAIAFLNYIPNQLIVWGVVRHPAFATMVSLAPTICTGIFFIVSSLSAVEVATPATAAITMGLVTTTNNLTLPLTTLFSNRLLSFFEIYAADGKTLLDTASGRFELFKLDTTVFTLQLVAILTLLLLPPQKRQLRQQLESGHTTKWLAGVIVCVLALCFLYSLAGNLGASSESLSCHVFFGGKGCFK